MTKTWPEHERRTCPNNGACLDHAGIRNLTVAEAKQAVTDRIDITRAFPDSTLAEIQAKIDSLCDQTEWLFHKVVVFLLR